jgi:acetolactate synthase I/II/III large subunit
MKGSELVINALKQHGIDTVFGYPGGTIMPIYDALYGSGLKHILSRHEQGAVFSAIGYARSAGKVGVCMATSGPGATNLITGLADALIDSVPLVAITGQVPTGAMGTDAFQEVDVLGLSLPVTKHSFLIDDPSRISARVHEAFQIATSGRPGPVLIDIPKDIQMSESPFVPVVLAPEPDRLPDKEGIGNARQLLCTAKRPVLYVGGGVGLAGAVEPFRRFLEKMQIPSVTTLKGIGAIPADYPYFLGMVGMHGNPAANKAVQRSDLLMCIGARFDDRVTGNLEGFAPDAKVIHLDIDPSEVGKRRYADVGLLGDLKMMLPLLAQPLDISAWQADSAALKTEHRVNYEHPGTRIYAPLLLQRLSDAIPDDTVICSDVGQHQMWVAQHMAFNRPENHLSSSGLGAMGFGLPAAIGAKLARPDACVINVCGDGSFMMNVQELATIKRYHLPVKILLLDNQRLGMVRQWQELFYEKRYSETDLSDNPDFVHLAESFNIRGRRISKDNEVAPALKEMLNAGEAYLLHVDLDPVENVWPLVPPGASNDEMMEEQRT